MHDRRLAARAREAGQLRDLGQAFATEAEAAARRNREQRDRDYREQALKLYPWICGRCAREFNRLNLHEPIAVESCRTIGRGRQRRHPRRGKHEIASGDERRLDIRPHKRCHHDLLLLVADCPITASAARAMMRRFSTVSVPRS